MKAFVFPRANEEAKELFRAGQKHGGPLSCQSGESTLSYTNRRKRWWPVLQELDSTMMLSDSLRAELLLELSGLSRQEILVTKACANPKNFEGYCKVLVDHYSGVHLTEGGKTWQGRSSPMTGKGKSYSNHSGKGKSFRSAYVSYPEVDEHSSLPWETMEETAETNFDEGDSHAWLGDGFDEEEEAQEQEFDYLEGEEKEAIALNAMLDLEEADDRQAGEAIQLQLAAFNAFGKAKGKGKGFGKKGVKGKGKGKVVRSQMSIEQRRAKLRDLKAKSKCLRCGGMGH